MAGAKDTYSDDHHPVGGVQSVDSSGNRLNRDCPSPLEVSCSICLELVVDDGTRSNAKLQCGHEFHLDCIGSAFNMKGAMQCPNCRNVEKGQWLYANGSARPFPEFTMEGWIPEEDLYGISYPEMQYRVHWCPFGELSQAGSFEELEPPTTTYHEYHGHHTVYAEHAAAAASSVNHSYLAYVGPGPVTTARSGDNNTDDHPWNTHSGQNDHFHQLAVAPQYLGLDHHHHHHHHSPSFSLPGPHVVAADLVHGEVDSSARGVSYPHPFLFSYRSNPRTSPAIHRHPGSSTQMREHIHTPHAFNHQRQPANGPNLASPLMAVTRRGVPPPPPPLPLQPAPEQNGGFFIYPPSSSTGERVYVPPHQRAISSFWHRHF